MNSFEVCGYMCAHTELIVVRASTPFQSLPKLVQRISHFLVNKKGSGLFPLGIFKETRWKQAP